MKKLFSVQIFFCLLPLTVFSQIIDFGEFNYQAKESEGFQKFKEYIGDTRIVIIGEQEHGIGTHYENFNVLSQFLHEEMGFDIIIQEYCFFEFFHVNDSLKKGGSSNNFRQGMYWPQGKAKEYEIFFSYLDDQSQGDSPIEMLGADPRIFARDKFQEYLKNELEIKNLILQDQERFLNILSTLLKKEYSDTLTSIEEQNFFLESCNSFTKQYQKKKGENFIWKERFIINLIVFANNAWSLDGLAMNHPDRFFQREKGMAENIIWLAKNRFPNKKILIHLHNGHMAKNTHLLKGILDSSQVKDLPNIGSLLHQEFGDQCLHFATSYYSGSYCKWDYKQKAIPNSNENSLESSLHKEGLDYGFIGFKEKTMDPTIMFYCDFNTWMINPEPVLPISQLFDGVIFIDKVKMPTEGL